MTAHDRDSTMAGLLRRSLATPVPAQGECPGPDLLAAYYERSLGSDEMSHCEAHVSHCVHCREQLAVMARAEAPPRAQPRHGWLLDWRLLASAATALLIVTVWGLNRPASRTAGGRVANEPLVAMSKNEQSSPAQSPPSPAPGVSGELRSQPELKKVSPQLQAPRRQAFRIAPKQLSSELPSNAPAAGNSLQVPSETQPAVALNRSAEPQVLDEKSATSPAPPASGPAAAQLAAPSAAANARVGSVAGTVAPGANAIAPAELPRAKQQSQSAAIVDKFDAANERALAQPTAERSAQKLIRTPDPKVLWRIAGGGFVERSQDSGATWRGQLPAGNAQLTAGAAPTTKALWLVGENGVILVTKDAVHWKKILPPVPVDFASVEARSASAAVVTATDGRKFSTSDSGKRWVSVP